MKQVSNSLLTLCLIPFNKMPGAGLPRDNTYAAGRHLTPFFVHQGNLLKYRSILLSLSCPPRSLVRSRMGEGRIRNLLHAICFILLVVSVISMTAPNASADTLVVDLKGEAVVESDVVLLKDIANLHGTDSRLLAKLATLNIDRSPDFGKITILGRQQIMEAIQKAVGSIPDGTVTGSQVVQIKCKGRQVSAAEITPLLKSYLLESTPWKESEFEIRSIGDLKGIEVPASGAELRLSSKATTVGRKRILAQIEVLQAGKYLRSFWIAAEVYARADIVTAARQIPPGNTITGEDVLQKSTEIADLHASYVRKLEDVLEKVSRHSFSPGDPLTRESLSDPYLVKSGEMVRLRLERDGIVLTSLAKAEQDGRLGQIIRVRNVDFLKVLRAQVTGRAEVKMQF
jgi:flagella basal body P-ring formation protein FlgA